MKNLVILLLVFSPVFLHAQSHTWIPVCQSQPEACSKKIVKVPPATLEKLAVLRKAWQDAEAKYLAADKVYHEAVQDAAKQQHLDHLPAMVEDGTMASWGVGTCTGSIELVDGYFIYTPASDIDSCGDYASQTKGSK